MARAPKLPILARNRPSRGAEPKQRQVKGGKAGGHSQRNPPGGAGSVGMFPKKGRK